MRVLLISHSRVEAIGTRLLLPHHRKQNGAIREDDAAFSLFGAEALGSGSTHAKRIGVDLGGTEGDHSERVGTRLQGLDECLVTVDGR